jgi:hypothetical protein
MFFVRVGCVTTSPRKLTPDFDTELWSVGGDPTSGESVE